jgi:hypothetical protein
MQLPLHHLGLLILLKEKEENGVILLTRVIYIDYQRKKRVSATQWQMKELCLEPREFYKIPFSI